VEPLWTPWRMPYIRGIKESTGCILCEEGARERLDSDLILHRGRHAFVVLNLYPYATGHLMVVPYRHAGGLADLTPEEIEEAALLLQRAERVLERVTGSARNYAGINIGRCAGAGVEGHLHIHLVPGGSLPPAGRAETVSEREPHSPGEALASASQPPEPLAATRERLLRAWAED